MRKFPTLCIDDFYKNPDAVRQLALQQDFCYSSDEWPGRRTRQISEIDPYFFSMFCEKLFSVYYEFCDRVEWEVLTNFQLVPPFSEDKNSLKNMGFIHRDDYEINEQNVVYAGIIYLTPNIDKNCGTSIFRFRKDAINHHIPPIKQNLYGKGDDTDFEKYMKIERDKFEETIRFDNIYNRMVSFDSSSYHGVNSFYSDSHPRLTQVFFVARIDSKSGYPLERSDRRNIL